MIIILTICEIGREAIRIGSKCNLERDRPLRTYFSFGLHGFHLLLGIFTDPFAAPQFQTNSRISEAHGAYGNHVCYQKNYHIVSGEIRNGIINLSTILIDPRIWSSKIWIFLMIVVKMIYILKLSVLSNPSNQSFPRNIQIPRILFRISPPRYIFTPF